MYKPWKLIKNWNSCIKRHLFFQLKDSLVAAIRESKTCLKNLKKKNQMVVSSLLQRGVSWAPLRMIMLTKMKILKIFHLMPWVVIKMLLQRRINVIFLKKPLETRKWAWILGGWSSFQHHQRPPWNFVVEWDKGGITIVTNDLEETTSMASCAMMIFSLS